MFSIENAILQEYGKKGRLIFSRVQHVALATGTTEIIDLPQGAIGYLFLGVTYSLSLVTGATNTIKLNGELYINYAAVQGLCGYIASPHFSLARVVKVTCSEADIVGTIDYQFISVE